MGNTPPVPLFAQPIVQQLNDSEFILVEDYTYYWRWDYKYFKIMIPKGFITDGASTPKWSRFCFLPTGLHLGAAVTHDFLYWRNKLATENRFFRALLFFVKKSQDRDFPKTPYYFVWDDYNERWEDISAYQWLRSECDRMFMRMMREAGMKPWKRWIMYQAVRVGGAPGWYK